MTPCPHCGANAWYRTYHRGRAYVACMCGFEASRAAFDPQYAAALREERERDTSGRANSRHGLPVHADRAVRALYEGEA